MGAGVVPQLVLALLLGAVGGAALILLASWGPLRIVDEDARWQAVLLDQSPPPATATFRAVWQDVRQAAAGNIVLFLCAMGAAVWAVVEKGGSVAAHIQLLFVWTLLVLGLIDWRTQLLPDVIVLPVLWLGLLAQILMEHVSAPDSAAIGLKASVLGAVVGYLMMWVSAFAYRMWRGINAVGAGDMKLLAMVGAWLGPQPLLGIILVAVVLGALWQGLALLRGKTGWREEFALGPWIVLATIAAAVAR